MIAILVGLLVLFINVPQFPDDYRRHGVIQIVARIVMMVMQWAPLSAWLMPKSNARIQYCLREALPLLRLDDRAMLEPALLMMAVNFEPLTDSSSDRWRLGQEFGIQSREQVAHWLVRTPVDELQHLSPEAKRALVALTKCALTFSRPLQQKDTTYIPFAVAGLLALATLEEGDFSRTTHPNYQITVALEEHRIVRATPRPRA